MTVIQTSERELSRLRIMVELEDGRLTMAAAASLMGIGQREVFRLWYAFATAGPSGLASKKRGRPSNHSHGATFRRTVLTLAAEKRSDDRCRDPATVDDDGRPVD
jgi:Helix-turn-helix domain